METYSEMLKLDVWTSTEVTKVVRDIAENKWEVTFIRGGSTQTLKGEHVVFAVGLSANVPSIPSIPGMVLSNLYLLLCFYLLN